MFVFAGIYFILGLKRKHFFSIIQDNHQRNTFRFLLIRCCAAAWEHKMRDKLPNDLQHKGAAASASVSHLKTIDLNQFIRLSLSSCFLFRHFCSCQCSLFL